jgi:two-component system sensor histidine kinase QseC
MTEAPPVHRSIQSRLLRSLLIGFIVLGVIFGAAFYAYMHRLLTREFDEVLGDRAHAIASMVELEPDGRYDFPADTMPEFQHGAHAQFFYIRNADGSEFARSHSLSRPAVLESPSHELTRKPVLFDMRLPDGRSGRAVSLWFDPTVDRGNAIRVEEVANPLKPRMQLILARERRPLDRTLWQIAVALLACEAILGVLTVWLLRRQLRESLQPLNDVARLAGSMDATSLHQRFPVETMPRELQPICQRLNDLLARIAKAVETQKRFNADAAHELRTPVAEVRALAEVAMRWPEDADATRKAFAEIVSVTQHMERLSSVLLQLSGGNGQVIAREEHVDVAKILRQVIERRQSDLAAKHITLTLDIPLALDVTSDSTLLTAVVENLVNNAIFYTPVGGHISCAARDAGSFEVTNGPTNLKSEDLATISEPFWRKDPSRTGGKMGLGLALTRAYLSTLGGSLELGLDESNNFSARVILRSTAALLPTTRSVASARE